MLTVIPIGTRSSTATFFRGHASTPCSENSASRSSTTRSLVGTGRAWKLSPGNGRARWPSTGNHGTLIQALFPSHATPVEARAPLLQASETPSSLTMNTTSTSTSLWCSLVPRLTERYRQSRHPGPMSTRSRDRKFVMNAASRQCAMAVLVSASRAARTSGIAG